MSDEVIKKYYAPMPWNWSELDSISPEDLYFGTTYGDPSGEIVLCSNEHPSKLIFTMLKKHEQFDGAIIQLRFLLTSFRQNTKKLFEKYDLSEDGIISTELRELPDVLFEASGLVYDVIVSGRRLVEHIETELKCLFGTQSEEYSTWKELASNYYDNCLPYALCYHLRNVIEHGFIAISTVNFNPIENTVGLAINLEAGLLQYKDLNAGVRERLVKFREERLSAGLSPWLSVGGTVSTFEGVVLFLYLWFLVLIKDSSHSKELPDIVLRGVSEWNCLVWKVSNDSEFPLFSYDRVYRFSTKNTLALILQHDAVDIRKKLVERWPELEEPLFKLIQKTPHVSTKRNS